MAKKDNKKKNLGAKSAALGFIIPLLITILIASAFFAIISTVMELVVEIIDAALDFFSDPVGYFKENFIIALNSTSSWLRRRLYTFASWASIYARIN